jgi:signal transduction histidine kinase
MRRTSASIRNAINFTNTGSIEVRVTSSPDNPEEGHIRFAVADTGIGISPELRERIFERFTQADSRSNREYGGVGLGLSICKQLVELMGGRIWVTGGQG